MNEKNTDAFMAWIQDFGVNNLAKVLKVNPATISYWRRGIGPTAKHMRKIKELAGGAVTYEDMIEREVRR